jgi:hypothetical protein
VTSEGNDEHSAYALGPSQPTERRGVVTRIRTSQTVAPELFALGLLYLGGIGADLRSAVPDLRFGDQVIWFFAGLLSLLAMALIVVGSFVIWLSPTPKPVEKWIAVASAILFPLALTLIAPSLPGRYESCSSGETGYKSKIISSYSYCVNGPNWVTHTVEWVWTLVPLAITLVLGTLAVRRTNRSRRAQHPKVQVPAGA